MSTMADTGGSSAGNDGAGSGEAGEEGSSIAERRRRLVTVTADNRSPPRLHQRALIADTYCEGVL